ncbi:MAG: hypothetical protein ACLFR8_01285 [Alkalispirochaeta sp.]
MKESRSVAVLLLGIIIAASTSLFLVVSIGTIRDSIWFSRILSRIERDGATEEHLSEAAEYARRPADWNRILRIAWSMPEPERWANVSEYALTAAERFPRDDSWDLLAVFGMIRGGRYEDARTVLNGVDSPSDLTQKLRVLAALDPDEPSKIEKSLVDLAERPDEERIARTIGLAFRDDSADRWFRAGEYTDLRAFYLQSALTAAGHGDHDGARRAAMLLREEDLFAGVDPAELYVAAWLRDDTWFFSAVASVGGSIAVEPATMLMQSDFLVEQRQWNRVAPIYGELRERYPRYSPIPFGNGALLERRTAPFPDDPTTAETIEKIYARGISAHPDDARLRLDLSAYYIATGRRLDAVRTLVPLGPIERIAADETTQRHWLLARTVLGSRTPVERLEADLWSYLNEETEAHLVAHFLARYFLIRDDLRGLADLRRRYRPDSAPWARTVHAMHAVTESQFSDADRLFAEDTTIEGVYNRALFALRHHAFLDTAAPLIDELRNRADPSEDPDITSDAAILAAELSRLQGDHASAVAIIDRAIAVNPYSNALYTYRANLARQN